MRRRFSPESLDQVVRGTTTIQQCIYHINNDAAGYTCRCCYPVAIQCLELEERRTPADAALTELWQRRSLKMQARSASIHTAKAIGMFTGACIAMANCISYMNTAVALQPSRQSIPPPDLSALLAQFSLASDPHLANCYMSHMVCSVVAHLHHADQRARAPCPSCGRQMTWHVRPT